MADIRDNIDKLLNLGVGDASRLTSIIETFEKKQVVYNSDRNYVDELVKKYLSSDKEDSGVEKKTFTVKVKPDLEELKSALSETNDPFSIINRRLASGEINNKEYDKLRKKLEKEQKKNKKNKKESIPVNISDKSNTADKPLKKKMSTKKKIGIGIGAFFGIIILLVGIAASLYFVAPGSMTNNPDAVTGISQYFVIKDGSLYKVRFSLVDKNEVYATSDAKVNFIVKTQDGRQLYSDSFNIKSGDFQTYSLVLTGTPVVAYAWQIDAGKLQHGDADFPKAYLTVTLSNGKSFTTDTPVF